MPLGLLITTCKHYFTNIPNLIKNIEECNFPKENILIVSGQEDENSTTYEDGIKIVKVDYTGLHLTGAIHICENLGLYENIDYWIMLPDTIKLGEMFYVNIMKYYDEHLKDKEVCSLPFINPKIRATMDIGIVNINHIYNISDYLNKVKKVQPYDENDVVTLKKQLIYDENAIFGLRAQFIGRAIKFQYIDPNFPKPDIFITNDKNEIIEKKMYINDTLCNEVHFLNVDMYKYQRNFKGPHVELVMKL
jgi:hypothetical protein